MTFEDSQEWTRAQDAADPLAPLRQEFLFPEGSPLYFAGHSLGLPEGTRDRLRAGTALEWLGRDAKAYDL